MFFLGKRPWSGTGCDSDGGLGGEGCQLVFVGQREPLTMLDAGGHAEGPELGGDGDEQNWDDQCRGSRRRW